VNKYAALRKDANILSSRWVFGFITNNPIPVDPLKAESVSIIMINGKRLKVRSSMGRFCDISEIFSGMTWWTTKLKRKISERNKDGEHVFNQMGNFKSNLCHVAQYLKK